MKPSADKDWCPKCKEDTSLWEKGRCAWCDTLLTRRPFKRGVPARLTDDQFEVLHKAHIRGASIRDLGRQVWQAAGYSSPKSAAVAISSGFKRLHLPARDRVEATVQASTTHGHGSRTNKAAYRRWHRRQTGEVRDERCNAVRTQYPSKGAQCQNMALAGGEYCYAHEPSRAGERAAILRDARSRL
jgi:hypothetical protein